MDQNRELLLRQARAVAIALGVGGGKTTLKVAVTSGKPMCADATLIVCLPVFGVPGRHALECRFARAALTGDMAVDACRDALMGYLSVHGLAAGIEAMRVTA